MVEGAAGGLSSAALSFAVPSEEGALSDAAGTAGTLDIDVGAPVSLAAPG